MSAAERDAGSAMLAALKRYQEIWSESLVDPTLGDDARAAIAQAEAAGIR